MELKEILAISGTPGLFKYVAQGKGGIIVESLADGRRTMVGGTTKVSALGDIAIFTLSKEVALGEVFQTIYDKQAGKAVALTSKSTPEELKAFMGSILPDFDPERVHNSDIKKIALWYNALVGVGMTSFLPVDEADGEEASAAASSASAKKTAASKKASTSVSSASASAKKTAGTASATAKRAPKAESRSKAPASKSTTVRKAQ